MPTPQHTRLAANIIAYGAAAAPAKFPKDDPIVLNVWADVLETINLPEDIWPEAIRHWAATTQTDHMASPWDIINAAKQVTKQWEHDPTKKYILEAHRWKHRVNRAKRNYGTQFRLDKVIPPPWWTGIDTTQDPTDKDTKEIARAGWHNAQKQPEPTNLAPAEIIQKAHNRQKALN